MQAAAALALPPTSKLYIRGFCTKCIDVRWSQTLGHPHTRIKGFTLHPIDFNLSQPCIGPSSQDFAYVTTQSVYLLLQLQLN